MKKRAFMVILILLILAVLGAQEFKNPFLGGEWLLVDFPSGCAHSSLEFLPDGYVKTYAKIDAYTGKKRTDTYTAYKYSIAANWYHQEIPLLGIDDFGTFFFYVSNPDKIIIASLEKNGNYAHTAVCALIRGDEIKKYGFGK